MNFENSEISRWFFPPSVGAVSRLPMASEKLSFYAVWENKNRFHFFRVTGTIFDGNLSLPNHMTFYSLVFFYYSVGFFPLASLIPKHPGKRQNLKGGSFSWPGQWESLTFVCKASITLKSQPHSWFFSLSKQRAWAGKIKLFSNTSTHSEPQSTKFPLSLDLNA